MGLSHGQIDRAIGPYSPSHQGLQERVSTLPLGLGGKGHSLSEGSGTLPVQRKIGLQPQTKNTPGSRWGTFPVQSGQASAAHQPQIIPSEAQIGLVSTTSLRLGQVSPLRPGGASHLPELPLLRPSEPAHLSKLGRGPRPPRPGSAPPALCNGAQVPFPGA